MLRLFPFLCLVLFTGTPFLYAQQGDNLDGILVKSYLEATSSEKIKISKKIIKQSVPFDMVYSALQKGKTYTRKVQIGFVEKSYTNRGGTDHSNLIFIPYKYNPEKKYQVKVYLHGAVANLNPRQIYDWINFKDTAWKSVNQIIIYPSGHLGSQWWSYSQIENINYLIDFVKSNYNVDENDVYLTGISDGGSGIYYQANVNPNPFSCYLPYIGSMEMLQWVKSKQFYLNNFKGLPFFIVNTRNDHIFELNVVKLYVDALKKVATNVKFNVVDTSGHTTKWYPALKDSIQSFIRNHKRNPFPNDIYFATENPDTIGRKFWVKILKLGTAKNESKLYDFNEVGTSGATLLPRGKSFGQIEVHKKGNRVDVLTTNIKKYSLLISPEAFDFSQPISIYTNNELSFEGMISKDIGILLKYNIIDNDRAMLYGSELNITVGKRLINK